LDAADGVKCARVYAHYAPSEQEVQLVDEAFASAAGDQFGDQIEENSEQPSDQKPRKHGA
jgi:hypothetical protein